MDEACTQLHEAAARLKKALERLAPYAVRQGRKAEIKRSVYTKRR